MAYQFTPELETGNAMIDEQHKQLFGAINDLLEACSSGKGRDSLMKTMNFLGDYTKKHFADEEALQMRSKYPDYPNHKRYHTEFIKKVGELSGKLEKEGATIVLVGEVNTTMAGWLISHIKQEDKKVAAHVKSVM